LPRECQAFSTTPLGADVNVSNSSAVVLLESRSYHQVSNLERMKRIRQIDQAIFDQCFNISAGGGKVLEQQIRVRFAAE